MTSFRMKRINSQLQRAISETLQRRIKKGPAKEAVITDVECSKDLAHAKVFFTVIDKHRRGEIKQALEGVSGVLRGMLGEHLHLRQIPELHFIVDVSEERAREIDRLLDSLPETQSHSKNEETDEDV
ncbi:MAG: 30S ribosome-binding factor RbfA [Synergistales bacterium]|nr:30S ribosome-binding factor RbfA [Synergistales bacterium]